MNQNFAQTLKWVLVHEGGFVNHPQDPGGATNKGITLETYRIFRQNGYLTAEDLKNISDQDVSTIYKKMYWDKIRGDDLPDGIDYTVFDAAVNSGPGRASKWLQACVGAEVDGVLGPKTLVLVKRQKPEQLIHDYCMRRLAFLSDLKTWEVFGKGWHKRVNEVERDAYSLTKIPSAVK